MRVRMYDLQHKKVGNIKLLPMLHQEACIMKSKMSVPSDWILVELKVYN